MAIIECSECKGKVSDTTATCPHCGAPVALKLKTEPSNKAKIIASFIVGLLMVSCVAALMTTETPADRGEVSAAEAITRCQQLLAKSTFDPQKAQFPYISAIETETRFIHFWNADRQMARITTNLGREVPVTALCTTEKKGGEIVELAIDGMNIPLK